MTVVMSGRNKIGALGEELTARFLMKHGFKILDRNFLRKWGELDIVAEQRGIIHFVEVKTVSHEINIPDGARYVPNVNHVTHETSQNPQQDYCDGAKDSYRAEDNIHPQKMARLRRIIQTYLSGKHVSSETPWQFDVAIVHLDSEKRRARVNFIEDIIL